MKLYTLSVLLLTASASCSAMNALVISSLDKVKAYNQENRRRIVEFKNNSIMLNDVETKFSDPSFLSVVDSILELSQSRYDYLQNLWLNVSGDQGYGWYHYMQEYTRTEMLFLKDRFMRHLATYALKEIFSENQERTKQLFIDVLNLLEKFHDLRIHVCRAWPVEHKPDLVSQILISTHQEENFQDYAKVLEVDVTVHDWYERMRKFDI